MRNFYLILFFAIATFNLHGQNRIDSLENRLKEDLSDTAKVRVLAHLSEAYRYVDFVKSKNHGKEALGIAERLDVADYKILAYRNTGSLYTSMGDYTTALKYDNLSLENSLALADSLNICRDYNNIGNDYYDLGEYDDAYFYFTQSYNISNLIHNKFRMLVALHNVGRVFKELGQFDRALDHLKLSQKMSFEENDAEGIAYSYDEIGDVMLRKNEIDSALITLKTALVKTRSLDVDVLEPNILSKIATVYLSKGEYDKALAYYDSAQVLHTKTDNKFGFAELELGRGIVFSKVKKYEQALTKIERSLEIAKELNARILEIKCYNQLSAIWEMKNNYEKSLYYFKLYKGLEDSLFSQEMQGKLFRDQIQFATAARDSKIAALSETQSLQKSELKRKDFVRNILFVVMALSVILLVSVYRSGQRRRQINKLLLSHQDEMETRSEELERLNQVKDKFFSIISHDLRSPINALAGLLDLLDKGAISNAELPNHVKEIKVRFNHTRTLLNNLLDWTLLQMDKLNLQPAKIDIRSITEENILLLNSVHGKNINLINEVPERTIAFADSNTVNLVIRNLITNAIKFTNDGGNVTVKGKMKSNEILVSVHDNGVGMKPEVLSMLFDKTAPYTTRGTANEKGTGLGLILCKEFVEKNGGKIWVESEEEKGSIFYFTLPKGS
ncbi:MAG TPA: tetratricopeptide repeat-containing sensor histidine kinase [Chryseolinea sp.]|nr:tetratricopeptide repeat-containing sensor histidine kinase [Chryseolinea sp.]